MIGREDSVYTLEYDDFFKILPLINDWHLTEERREGGKEVNKGFSYTSDNNSEWMTCNQLEEWIQENFEEERVI